VNKKSNDQSAYFIVNNYGSNADPSVNIM
jgi:hypothetical protein